MGLSVITHELQHKPNNTQSLTASSSSYPLELPAWDEVHLYLVPQFLCAEDREDLPQECEAEEDSQHYVQDPGRYIQVNTHDSLGKFSSSNLDSLFEMRTP